jgi:MtN3 and saliva related transmembrane protein
MSVLSNLAVIAGVSMGLSSIPQIHKIFTRRSASDISKITHVIIIIGALIWMLYGFEINSIPIILSNFIGIVTNAIILIGCYWYKNN